MAQTSIHPLLIGNIGSDPTKGGTSVTVQPHETKKSVTSLNVGLKVKTKKSSKGLSSGKNTTSSGGGIIVKTKAGEDTLEGAGSGDSSGGGSSGEGDSGGGDSGGSFDSGSSGSDGSSSSGSGTTSPLLEGSMTFEELVGEICDGLDLIFVCKRSTVVVTDYESLYAEAKYLRDNYHSSVRAEDIALWQLEDGTYELDVNEYGFYNTVIIEYKNGTIEESYEDLVRVYGKVPITYKEKTLDKSSAIMKAKAYLAAHVRDFDMSIKANLLHDADIDIGDIVTLENPMTMRDQYRKDEEKRDPEYFFVMGNSINWDGDGGLLNSIELRYGAKSPEKKEVPETGASYSKSSSSDENPQGTGGGTNNSIKAAVQEVGKMASKITYSGACQTHDCVKQQGTGDCFGMSDFIACELISRGVSARIRGYPTYVSEHRSVQYQTANGEWKNFPYREFNCNWQFNDTSNIKNSHPVKTTCGGDG